jgi:selenocysteine lyase/cysteine desulfurase/nucleoside-diphosphate-sugar epimerase
MQLKKDTILILGGDGYLGWSLGLAFGNRTDLNVVLVDNLIKREWEKEVGAKLLVPFKAPRERIAEYKKIFSRDNLSFEKVELLDQEACVRIIKKHKPTIIINAAQQPSAPFSMMNAKGAAATFSNNILGHLNVLWAIAQIDKNIKYIKLGSAGCYMDIDTDYLPLGKKDFTFEHEGEVKKILNAWFPMQATDFYHQSKISDFLINDLCASVWKLKILTVQQSTIFGATIDENHAPERHALSTRFNYDAVFSTVLNRFVCQLAIGHPLTVYGDGSQTTGLISLRDTIESFFSFANLDLAPGEHHVVHNYTHRLSIKEIAEALTRIAGAADVRYIENPRKEGGGSLKKQVEVHHAISHVHTKKEKRLEKELREFLEFTQLYKDNIDTSIIMPKVRWEDAGKEKSNPVSRAETSEKIFFNYGAVGKLGAPAYRAVSAFLHDYYHVGPPEVLYKYEPYVEKLAREAGALLNCEPSEITYIKNTTEGLNIAADALPLQAGDEVLVSAGEYPATLLVWQRKKKEGIDVQFVEGEGNKEIFAALMKQISPRTKAIALSAIQHYDGYIPDLERISRTCRERGIFLIVDGAQMVGVRSINLKKTPVDFLICGGQKYLGGIVGIGFMYVSKRVMGRLRDTKVGIRSMEQFSSESYTLKDSARRFEDGTINLVGIVALHAALKHLNRVGMPAIERKNLELLATCKAFLSEAGISFIDYKRQGNIVSVQVENPISLAQYLRDQNIVVKHIGNIVRISFSHYSRPRDFKFVAQKIKEWIALQPVESPCSDAVAEKTKEPVIKNLRPQAL